MKLKNIILGVAGLGFAVLTGCASIVDGTEQSVSVVTHPNMQAACSLSNNKGTWYVTAPGTATVHRSFQDLDVKCQSKHMVGQKKVASSTKPMAFGNILFGGVPGAGIDAATGAAYDYPQESVVNMHKSSNASNYIDSSPKAKDKA